MLVITRRVGEILRIGEDVSLQVLSVKGKQVCLGITAPVQIAVHREELYRRIEAEQVAAGAAPDAASVAADAVSIRRTLSRRRGLDGVAGVVDPSSEE